MNRDFHEFGKIARLSRECVITEKIDGTNAQIHIVVLPDDAVMPTDTPIIAARPNPNDAGGEHTLLIYAGSRNRYLTVDADNFSFAAWVRDNADALVALGPGRHYGEWWGSGIQRGYGLEKGDKRFSLFNTSRWTAENVPACCSVVPVLYRGIFSTEPVGTVIERLRTRGSEASPGFMKPEGVICYHVAGNIYFKKTLEKDEEPKGKGRAV